MSVFPVNRVPDILKRMEMNSSQAEAMKTCFGILAIMSREDANKILIAKDGMEIILNAMNVHIDRTDVQESGCDLLWSLAFNSAPVKELIAKNNGATILVKALKRHSRSADFLKSACGALSNMCQHKANQEGVSSQGGLPPLVGSIHVHQANAKLLPFVFDAIASIIVNNEENARSVSSLGIIPVIVASLSRHKSSTEVVKSGCHTLAILSDVKGQASKVAFAGGVPIILSLLDAHPMYSDLHRVAAVVLLRMLQESAHVGKEVTGHDGVRILLNSLEKGGAQQDTVAAVTHILYTVTNPANQATSSIEPQLWVKPTVASADVAAATDAILTNGMQTTLGGVVTILGQYYTRRDVVRAACRLINNLSSYPDVVTALNKLFILDKMLQCVHVHKDTKDVLEATAAMLKNVYRRGNPSVEATNGHTICGLVQLYRSKAHDEEISVASSEMLQRIVENMNRASGSSMAKGKQIVRTASGSANDTDDKMADGRSWEYNAVSVSLAILENVASESEKDDNNSIASSSQSVKSGIHSSARFMGGAWSKATVKVIGNVISLLEVLCGTGKLTNETILSKDATSTLGNLLRLAPTKGPELIKRLEKVLQTVDTTAGKKTVERFTVNKKMGGIIAKSNSSVDLSNQLFKSKSQTNDDAESDRSKSPKDLSATSATNKKTTAQNDNNNNNNRSGSGNNSTSTTGYAVPKIHGSNSNMTELEKRQLANEAASKGSFNEVVCFSDDPDDKKLYPRHPCKFGGDQQLLATWPTYLERLLTSPNASANRAYVSTAQQETGIPTRMCVAYEGSSAAGKGVLSRCPTPVPYVVPQNSLGEPFAHSVTFDSEFESGNLLRAVQRGDAAYDLFLRSDLHTAGHTQWFYFAVSNTHPPELVRLADQGVQVPPVRVRFHIINLTKPDSLFNLGMRPLTYSVHDASNKGVGWVRAGSEISYYSNSFLRNNNAGEGLSNYYTLSFSVEFHNPRDTVLIAYSYPYTNSDYKSFIRQIMARPHSTDIVRQLKLCTTLAGEDCDLLVITNFKDKDKDRIGPITLNTDAKPDDSFGSSKKNKAKNFKPALFVSARVHPGETPASWMMQGMLEFLTSNSAQAQLLRHTFVFFIVPMLNPDGVMFGNNRCALAGVDLNRQWRTPLRNMHPTVYYLKALMAVQRRVREIAMYVDLHGHSRKYNVFMYGCDDKKRPKPQVRAFPKFFSLHQVGKKYVCYSDCSFHVKKGRESTARVVVSKEMNIPCSFTLEATFCGSNYGPLKHCHMNIGHLQETGAALCDTFLNFMISEGFVKDPISVPLNLKAVTQIEKFIAEEDTADGDHSLITAYYQSKVATRATNPLPVAPSNSKPRRFSNSSKKADPDLIDDSDSKTDRAADTNNCLGAVGVQDVTKDGEYESGNDVANSAHDQTKGDDDADRDDVESDSDASDNENADFNAGIAEELSAVLASEDMMKKIECMDGDDTDANADLAAVDASKADRDAADNSDAESLSTTLAVRADKRPKATNLERDLALSRRLSSSSMENADATMKAAVKRSSAGQRVGYSGNVGSTSPSNSASPKATKSGKLLSRRPSKDENSLTLNMTNTNMQVIAAPLTERAASSGAKDGSSYNLVTLGSTSFNYSGDATLLEDLSGIQGIAVSNNNQAQQFGGNGDIVQDALFNRIKKSNSKKNGKSAAGSTLVVGNSYGTLKTSSAPNSSSPNAAARKKALIEGLALNGSGYDSSANNNNNNYNSKVQPDYQNTDFEMLESPRDSGSVTRHGRNNSLDSSAHAK